MHGGEEKESSMHRVRIVDGEALRAFLEEVKSHEGSDQKAANRLGIEQTTFTKLRTGTTSKAMSYPTYSSILKSLGGHASENWLEPDPVLEFGTKPSDAELRTEMLRTGKTADRAEADLWAASDERAHVDAGLLERFQKSFLTEEGREVWFRYQSWLREELRRIRPKLRYLVPLLRKHEVYRNIFRGFLERVRGSPEPPLSGDKRILVAVYRALELLYGAEETRGVERSIQDLHAEGDLGDFLKAALKCEEILMRRERDLDRLIGLAPAEDYGEWLAKAEEDGLE